jgi:RNA polymerase sigma-70 factor (sigma-E family)
MTRAGDEDYIAFVNARLSHLRRAAHLLCGDWARGDDLVQRTLTDVYRDWRKASRANSLEAYVRTVMVHRFLDDRRHRWSRVTLVDAVPDRPRVDPIDSNVRLDLDAALAELPPKQRAVLVLRFLCDMSVHETANTLSCSPGTVKSQTSDALTAMRRLLTTDYVKEHR